MEKGGLELEITELKLGLPGGGGSGNECNTILSQNEKKRVLGEVSGEENGDRKIKMKNQVVVGWPPVCSYRKKNIFNENEGTKMYVKVSMDGAPYLRKIDLSMHKGYSDFGVALEKLFGFFGISEGLEFAPIYEDKDGDWMLMGDVPWEMFIETCKRLRIMKKSEAKGFGISKGD